MYNDLEIKELLKIYGKSLPEHILIIGTDGGDIVSSLMRESPIGSKFTIIATELDKQVWYDLADSLDIIVKVLDIPPLDDISKEMLPRSVDFLFIDYIPNYHVLTDLFDKYSTLLFEGGIIAIGNIAHSNENTSRKFWEEIKRELPHEEIYIGSGIGVLYV
jgi:predicted O-methyltransferase YrrM